MSKAKKKPAKSAHVKIVPVELASLKRLPGVNPNVMNDHDFQALKAAIINENAGYLQPILVAACAEGGYTLVDGEHRVRALLELGFTHADVSVCPSTDARALRLSMHLRGEHDSTLVAQELQALLDSGYDAELLAQTTPFDLDDITTLTSGQSSDILDLTLNMLPPPPVVADEDKAPAESTPDHGNTRDLEDESTYNLTLRFTAKTDRDNVLKTLKQHGVTVEDGVLVLLGLKD